MKVVLLKDVQKVGHKFDIKNVADGFALNFLIPRKLAEVATPEVIKRTETLKSQLSTDIKIQEDLLIKSLKSIDGVRIELNEKANEKGHLFAAIHKEELIKEIGKKTGFGMLPEFIILEKPIKEVGEHSVTIKVGDKTATIKVVVVAK